MSKTVKVICTVRKGYLLSLPGNIKVWGGAVTKIPAELLDNPGIKAYIKSGRLKLVDEADAEILPLQSPPSAPATKPEPEVVEVAPEAPSKKERKKKAAEETQVEEVPAPAEEEAPSVEEVAPTEEPPAAE